jgi:flagellar biosynthesis GTPase FlhF
MSVHAMKRNDPSAAKGKRMMPRAFRAKNMPAALAAVEKALGNEALIVSVHPLPAGPAWQLWRRDGVEVVAMPSAMDELYSNAGSAAEADSQTEVASAVKSDESAAPSIPADSPMPGGRKPDPAPHPEDARMRNTRPPASDLPPSLEGVQERLRRQGVEEGWLSQALRSVQEESSPRILADEGLTRELVRQEMQRRLRSDGGACLIRRKVIFLIGSSGCGKTTVCAKIAAYAMKALGKRIHWISADTTRAGAIAKAQAFTAPLGISLHLTYRPEELHSVLHWESDTELFLVDTPGFNPYRKEELDELDLLLVENPDRHILWVIPATAKESDLQDSYDACSHLGIGGVVISRLDETRAYGGLFNFLHHNQLPIAFLSHGPRIQDNFHSGETSLLVSLLLGEKHF